jgi:2-iminobutanoate/2-iminopropanoate deaminase
MSKAIKTVVLSKGPAALGPYSVGKIYNGTAFISGQLGINPDTNELADSIEDQT